MQFETFRGRDVSEALAAVRAAYGSNALIGSTRRVSNDRAGVLGSSFVEITAAPGAEGRVPDRASPFSRDVVRARFADAFEHDATRPPPRSASKAPGTSISIGTGAPARLRDESPDLLAGELRRMRGLLEEIVAAGKPRDRVLGMLHAAGIDGTLAQELAAGMPRQPRMATAETRDRLRERIAPMLRVAPSPIEQPGPRIVACVGPTGVGKTTTLAKLAARAHFELGRSVAIVTLDTYRVGAAEQMRRFADLLGVPFDVAHDRATFAQALASRGGELTLVDTPSRAPNDTAAMNRLASCLSGAGERPHDVLLAVPASIRPRDVERLAPLWRTCPPTALVVTKLDETDQAGGAIHAAVRGPIPIAYLCDGPRVPEDLHDGSVDALLDAVLPREP